MNARENDVRLMRRAIELAWQGLGRVEPNPMVGCVIAQGKRILAEAWHQQFGGPHAEIEALRLAGDGARDATMYVSLEPCCHHGKTPPCSKAIIDSGIRRVVMAMRDPFPQVAGQGIRQLVEAGIDVAVGVLEAKALWQNAPFIKLVTTGRPWIIAKWAMTLDGKIASRTGHSRWVSGEASRACVHALRGRVDAVIVGSGTARADDPLLTARPEGPRTATRIVVDSRATLASESQLVRTAADAPVLVAAGPEASEADRERLTRAGCEVFLSESPDRMARLIELLDELGRRQMTNVLVEGGAEFLGSLLDAQAIDEVHAFIAPKLIGGAEAAGPIGGGGISEMGSALSLVDAEIKQLGSDVFVRGRVAKADGASKGG